MTYSTLIFVATLTITALIGTLSINKAVGHGVPTEAELEAAAEAEERSFDFQLFREDAGSVTPDRKKDSMMRATVRQVFGWAFPGVGPSIAQGAAGGRAYIVNGRMQFGRRWYSIVTEPRSLADSKIALEGLHGQLAHTPHFLTITPLGQCLETLADAMRG